MQRIKYLEAIVSALVLMASTAEAAEWWHGSMNGSTNYYLDAESIRTVERLEKVKAWIAFVTESESDSQSPAKGNSKKSQAEIVENNSTLRILEYVDCAEWTAKQVQILKIDKKSRETIGSPLISSPEFGYTDIDTESIGHQFALIMCAANTRQKLEELGWSQLDSDEDYISHSATFSQVTNYLNKANAAKKAGRPVEPPPPEVLDWLNKEKLRRAKEASETRNSQSSQPYKSAPPAPLPQNWEAPLNAP